MISLIFLCLFYTLGYVTDSGGTNHTVHTITSKSITRKKSINSKSTASTTRGKSRSNYLEKVSKDCDVEMLFCHALLVFFNLEVFCSGK